MNKNDDNDSRNESWLKKTIAKMDKLKEASENERSQWEKDAPINFGWAMCDRSVIFDGEGDEDKGEDSRSAYHIPIVSEKIESFVAAVNSNEVKPRYIPKLDQDKQTTTPDIIARMGNASFDSYRSHIGWDHHMHIIAKELAIFDRAYVGLCVDYVKDFPSPRADVRRFNAWQVYHTPGVRFEDAKQILLYYYIDREEAKAQWPEFVDEIKGLGSYQSDKEAGSHGIKEASEVSQTSSTPGYGAQDAIIDDNSVLVRELWRFDASLQEYSKSDDEADIAAKNRMIDSFVRGEITLEQIDLASQFKDEQYHTDHVVADYNKIKALMAQRDKVREVEVAGPDLVRTIVPQPMVTSGEMQRIAEVIPIIKADADQHETFLDELGNPFLEGKYPKYEGGWRHTIILGNGNDGGDAVDVYDDVSQFLEYGIKGVPVYEFSLMGWPLYHWGPSYVQLMIDLNKIIDSFLNSGVDNARLFGNHSLWGTQQILDDSAFHFSNDPAEPNQLPDGAIQGNNWGIIDGKPLPSDVMGMIGLALNLSQQIGGVHNVLQGKGESGVRSAAQTQALASLNMVPLEYKMKRIKPVLEHLFMDLFKLMLAIPPDDNLVKPMIDGKIIEIDYNLLRDIDFVIEVVLSPSGQSSNEERQSMMLGMVQNFSQILQGVPGGIPLLIRTMGEGTKIMMPDFSESLIKMANELEKMQAAQMAQGNAAPPQGAQNSQGNVQPNPQ